MGVALMAVLLVLSGCASKQASPMTSQNQSDSKVAQRGGDEPRNGRMPDFGQPERVADLRGVVTTVVGNEVTVLKIALNQERRASSTESNTGSSTSEAPALSLNGSVNNIRGSQGNFGGPGGPGGGPGQGDPSATNRTTMLANLKAMSTGQEKIIIPVGIKMMKSEIDATGKRTMIEASLTDVIADKMITVWLNTSVTDKKIADFILIN